MKRHHLDVTAWEKEALKDPKLQAEYDALQPEFALIDSIIKARKERNLTQAQLALKIGTKQSVISRLEIGKANPSVNFLKKLARAIHTNLEINFIPDITS